MFDAYCWKCRERKDRFHLAALLHPYEFSFIHASTHPSICSSFFSQDWLIDFILISCSKLGFNKHLKVVEFIFQKKIQYTQNMVNGARAFSSSLLLAIIARNHLPLFKIFSNFVQILPKFSDILLFFNIFLPFF